MRLIDRARTLGFVILAVVTLYGAYKFATGDWSGVLAYWRTKVETIPAVLLLASLDLSLEGIAWIWVYCVLGLDARGGRGACAFLAGRAGLLLPAQLGRLIRPDVMARLGGGGLTEAVKAEAVVLVLDIAAVFALLAGLVALLVSPWSAPLAVIAVIGLLWTFPGLLRKLSGARFDLGHYPWRSWHTLVVVALHMVGWVVHGSALYLLIRDLPGNATLLQTVISTTGSAFLGAGSGLPGGIGATEGLLGVSLSLLNVPAAHLAMAIGGFRLLTFWIWIPVGWMTLLVAKRWQSRLERAGEDGAAKLGATP